MRGLYYPASGVNLNLLDRFRPSLHTACVSAHAFEPARGRGAPVSVAQTQLRHADPRITLGNYSHVVGDSRAMRLRNWPYCVPNWRMMPQ